jgi:NAD(P)-dependent dehydrogenase (short-subunit alcohol dehydrogenase family)
MKIESGQVAVVTGAASGIGLAICEALAARGVRLVMADVARDLLREAVDRDRGHRFPMRCFKRG